MKIRVSKNGKVFVHRASKSGRIQKAFGETIGSPVGQCVRKNVNAAKNAGRPMSKTEIHETAAKCAAPFNNTHLSGFMTKEERAAKRAKIWTPGNVT